MRDEATDLVLRFVAARWGAVSGEDVGMQVKRAAKTKGIAGTRGEHLRTLARRFDMLARVADGEDIDVLLNERIDVAES